MNLGDVPVSITETGQVLLQPSPALGIADLQGLDAWAGAVNGADYRTSVTALPLAEAKSFH